MPYLIGTDEAGYGPNLGPLLISASLWHVKDNPAKVDLYERLTDVVTDSPAVARKENKIAIADSKQLYSQGKGLASLERGLFSALAMLGHRPQGWADLWEALCGPGGAHQEDLPWYRDYQQAVPVDVDCEQTDPLAERFRSAAESSGIRLLALKSVAVFPPRFNTMLGQLESKGALLSQLTLELLGSLLEGLDEPVLVICDKHGGRNRYAPLLQHQFPDSLIQILDEGRAESIYRFGPAERQVEVQFRAGGERFLPAALASMACKYLRELAMGAFCDFWCSRLEGLRPTAGYPVDAKRFKAEIAELQQALDIDDHDLWRAK